MILPTFEDVLPSDVILTVEDFQEEVIEDEEIQEEAPVSDLPEEELPEGPTEGDPLARVAFDSLVEKGILEPDSDFKKSFEELDSKFEGLPNKLLRSAIDELPDHSQTILKFIASAGTNLTADELQTFIKEYYKEQDTPEISTADEARSYLEQQFKTQGLRPSAIQAQLDELEDEGKLEEEAGKLLKSKNKVTDTLLQEKELENSKIVQAQKDFNVSVQTALQETTWSKPQREKVLQVIPKANQILNDVIKTPKAYLQLMDLLSMFDGKEFDLEHIKKQGESRVSSSIKEKLEKSGFSSAATKTKSSSDSPLKDEWKNYKPIV